MRHFECLALILVISTNVIAEYKLNGKISQNGIYEYAVKFKPREYVGDSTGSQYTFANGVLFDGKTSHKHAVGFVHRKNINWDQRIYFDLGNNVTIEKISVKSKKPNRVPRGQWQLRYIEMFSSEDGKNFSVLVKGSTKLSNDGKFYSLKWQGNRKARFLRLDVNINSWKNIQIGEVDIIAKGKPASDRIKRSELNKIIREQNSGFLIDRYGQYARDTWTGKIYSDKQLAEAHKRSLKDLKPLNQSQLDKFRGVIAPGINYGKSDKFRIKKIAGRWWFITPEGNLFILKGVDGMNVNLEANTVKYPGKPEIRQRFAWIPDKTETKFRSCFMYYPKGVVRFNFSKANLIRIFGSENLREKFLDSAVKRLKAWGFNSLGKWTNSQTIETLKKMDKSLPFVPVLRFKYREGYKPESYHGVKDPFDPEFKLAVERSIKQAVQIYNSPYYLGFTIENESWWDTNSTLQMLRSDRTHAKIKFVTMLKQEYKSAAALNKAAGTKLKEFKEAEKIDLSPYAKKLDRVVKKFVIEASKTFYSTWKHARDKFDPGRIMIGSSFVVVGMWRVSPEWIEGSMPYTDIAMCDHHNLNPYSLIKEYIKPYAEKYDKPVINGEASFTTTDCGYKYFRTNTISQQARGLAYKHYNEVLYANPYYLGTMYFLYRDQPFGGRNIDGGGESYNFGLVNLCNLPYQEFIDQIKKTNERLFNIHLSGK